VRPEMELMDISLKKDLSLLLHALHSFFYWRILKKTILFSGFQNSYKKFSETRKPESIHELHLIVFKKEGRKPDKNSSL
jgi:hypothetical protein